MIMIKMIIMMIIIMIFIKPDEHLYKDMSENLPFPNCYNIIDNNDILI